MGSESPFSIIEKSGYYAIKDKKSAVAVLVYTLSETGEIEKIGVVEEKNPHFSGETYKSVVMGSIEKDDPSLFFRAKQETLEESGYDVSEEDRWDFLKELHTSKIFPDSLYCYAVDVTGLPVEKPKGDGSEHEKSLKFHLLPLNQAMRINDSLLYSCFLLLFMKLYKTNLTDGNS